MTSYSFIFSDTLFHRITRHVVFWLVFSIHIFLFRYYVYDLKYLSYASTYLIRLQNLLLFLPVSIFYAYFAIYFLLPHFLLKDRYAIFLLIVLLLSILLVLFSYFISTQFNIRLAFDMPLNRSTIIRQIDFTVSNGLVYPLTVSAFAIGIKMAKIFYLQQKQNEQLAKQKIKAEVQMLKSQVHPRFLFHSLNSIYHDMLNGTEQSPALLLKLSDLLSYILYESDEKLVPLEKEVTLLQNYIDLEKASWGNKLSVHIGNEINTGGKFIAPLLLLPLAESVFEQADKNRQQHFLLNMNMLIKENTFVFVLSMSGYEENTGNSFTENMELIQVKKRLKALYADKHDFKIETDTNAITISLSVVLNNNI
jgi:LytS/YehU family sensor histidine kinase